MNFAGEDKQWREENDQMASKKKQATAKKASSKKASAKKSSKKKSK